MSKENNEGGLQGAWNKAASAIKQVYIALRKEFYKPSSIDVEGTTYMFLDDAVIRQVPPRKSWRDRTSAKDIDLEAGTYNPSSLEVVVTRGGPIDCWDVDRKTVLPLDMSDEELLAVKKAGVKLASNIMDDYAGYIATGNDKSNCYQDRLYRAASAFVEKYGAETGLDKTLSSAAPQRLSVSKP